MKFRKRLPAAAFVLLLLSLLLPSAFGDAIYPAPGTIEAGSYLDHLVATVGPGLPVAAMEGTLPPGVELAAEEGPDGLNVFLRGVPSQAGSYNCLFTVGEGGSLSCPLTVVPATPYVTGTGNVSCFPNERVQIAVLASAPDFGSLSYQWYYSQYGDNSTGSVIGGENRSELNVVAGFTGTSYYYCVVTNTNNGQSVSVPSQVIAVSVSQDSIRDVSLLSLPSRTSYTVGDFVDTGGLQLRVIYTSGNMDTVTGGFSVTPSQFSYAGVQSVQVVYEGYSFSYDVTVQEAQEIIDGIGVLTLPTRTRYRVGDTLDTTGLSVRAYTNLGFRDVNSGLSCLPTVFSYEGEQFVTVSYGGKSCTFSVYVEPALPPEQPESLVVETPPSRTSYTVGETLDLSGLVLKQITNRQNVQHIYTGYTCTPNQLTTVGHQTITVQYGALSTSFSVTVLDVQPSAAPQPTAPPSPSPLVQTTAQPLPSSAPRAAMHASHQSSIGRSLIAVIVVSSLAALGILGVYVYIQNLGGFEEAGERLRELFRRKGGRK